MWYLTRLYQPHVENLLDLRVVSCDVEDAVGRVLDASDVHGHQVLGDLLPLDCTTGRVHMEHLRPESENRDTRNYCQEKKMY